MIDNIQSLMVTVQASQLEYPSMQKTEPWSKTMIHTGITTYTELHKSKFVIEKSNSAGPQQATVNIQYPLKALASLLNFQHKNNFPVNSIAGEKTYIIQGSNPQSLNWEEYGFKMHFPAHTLSSPDDHCEVSILALIGGMSFIYPENAELVSCIYSVELSKEINKCARVEIEHCVSLKKESDLDHLIFAASEKSNPEILTAVEGAKFIIFNRHGVVEQMHFCTRTMGVFKKKKSRVTPSLSSIPETIYSGYLFSKNMDNSLYDWLVKFIVLKDITTHKEYIKIAESQKKRQFSFKFEFLHSSKESVIVLDMSEPVPEGWKLMPECEPLYLSQSDIDIFEPIGKEIQYRRIDVHAEKTAKLLNYSIKLKGIKIKGPVAKRYFIKLSPQPEPILSPGIPDYSSDLTDVDSKALQGMVKNALNAQLDNLSTYLTPVLDTFMDKMVQAGLVASNIRGATYDGIMQQFVSALIFDGVQEIEKKCHKLFCVFGEMGVKNAGIRIKKDLRRRVHEELHINNMFQ